MVTRGDMFTELEHGPIHLKLKLKQNSSTPAHKPLAKSRPPPGTPSRTTRQKKTTKEYKGYTTAEKGDGTENRAALNPPENKMGEKEEGAIQAMPNLSTQLQPRKANRLKKKIKLRVWNINVVETHEKEPFNLIITRSTDIIVLTETGGDAKRTKTTI